MAGCLEETKLPKILGSLREYQEPKSSLRSE
jgi:hypothetical protein